MSQDYLLFVNTGLIVRWVIWAARYCQISAHLIGKDRISIENRLWGTNKYLWRTFSLLFVLFKVTFFFFPFKISQTAFLSYQNKVPIRLLKFPSLGCIIPSPTFRQLFSHSRLFRPEVGFCVVLWNFFKHFLTLVSSWLVLGSSKALPGWKLPSFKLTPRWRTHAGVNGSAQLLWRVM